MLKGDLDQLALNDAHTITWQQVSDDETADRTLEFKGLYIVNAERLLHGGPGDANALFLVEFADGRYLAGLNSATGPVRANLRSYANAADYLTGTSTTWDNLLSDLWSTCGTLGSYPNLPATLPIDGRPENTWLIGLNSLRSLNSVLEQLDCAIQPDPFANTFSIVQLGAAQTIDLASEVLKWNAEPPTVNSNKAATLRVHFFYHKKAYGQERDTELDQNWAVVGASDVLDRATGISGAVGMKFLWDDLPMVFDETNTHTNSSDTNQRADNRKSRYVTRYSVANAHRIYAGLVSMIPGGQVRAVLWRNYDDGEESDLGGTVTEFISRAELVTGLKPSGGGPAWFDGELAAPEREMYAGPDYSRHSFPNYPRISNVVQVTNDDVSVGAIAQANASGFHLGQVKRWVSNSMATMDPCWIRFVDRHDTFNGNVPAINGDYFGPGRLCGVETVGGVMLPVYLVRRGGNSSAAQVYFKIVIERVPPAVHHTAHFEGAFGDTIPDRDASGNFIVWDSLQLFPRALNGGFGIAEYNSVTNRWEMTLCQQQALLATAIINNPGGTGGANGGMDGTIGMVPIASFRVASPSPFNLHAQPTVTEAFNKFGHMGQHGDEVLLASDEYSEKFIIINVVKKKKKVVFDVMLNADKTQIQVTTTDCAVEYNIDPTDVNKIPTGPCP